MINIALKKITLSNGLDVILHEDHAVPLVAVNVWYHVGSKDEQPGRTGFAHLFEHIMFDGSKHHNKSFFEPLQRVGGSLNGSTTRDRTNYWENIPANELELALWLESDRMGFLLDALDQKRFETERDVVHNERRQSYENRPYGMASIHMQSALFPLPHPYHWSTIGEAADLNAATLDDVKSFFNKYYAPSNASLTIAGDIDPEATIRLVEKYFADLPPRVPVTRLTRRDSDLKGAVDLVLHDKVQLPRLYLSWPSPAHFSADDPAATILSTILGDGKRSRLFRTLEYEKQIVQEVMAFHFGGEIAGQLQVIATPAPGHTLGEVQKAIEVELERLRQEPPTAEEIAGAKNRLDAMHVHQLERVGGFGGRADQLNGYNVFTGNPEKINTEMDEYRAVRAEDVQRVAAGILTDRRVQLVVLPEPRLSLGRSAVDRTAQPQGQAPKLFHPPAPTRRRLANGLSVLVLPKRDLPIVSLGVLLTNGAAADPEGMPGLAYVTAGLLEEGTQRLSSQQLAAEFEFIGAELFVRADRTTT
ncbi:MAG: insulinase family protein, partial [SAR202 cluster bacterium]|nr:insulinase family protein [SAR202 cluster bacterium]